MTMLVVPLWISCGIIAAGWTRAYFWHEFPWVRPQYRSWVVAMIMACLGPIGLVMVYVLSERVKHSWRLR